MALLAENNLTIWHNMVGLVPLQITHFHVHRHLRCHKCVISHAGAAVQPTGAQQVAWAITACSNSYWVTQRSGGHFVMPVEKFYVGSSHCEVCMQPGREHDIQLCAGTPSGVQVLIPSYIAAVAQ